MSKSFLIRGVVPLLLVLAPEACAANFTVTTTLDAGPGSLRDAIVQANNAALPPVIIDFNVPASLLTAAGVAVIQPRTPLPVIQNIHGLGIQIDGYTQPGSSFAAGNPSSLVVKVELDGSLIPAPYLPPPPPAPQFAHGLYIMSSNNRVQGLCIHSFPHDGISIQGILPGTARHPGSNGNQIYWNLVGTDVRGMAALPNGHDTPPGLWGGIYVKVLPNSPGIALGNHILENVASGNKIEGIGIANCPDVGDVANNRVERCYVGIDITGAGPLGNGHQGVYIGEGAHHNLIEQNWIGANGFDGVGIVGFGPSGLITHSNTLDQNRIGVDVNLNPMPNQWHGVAVGSYGGTVWGFAPDNVIIHNTIAWNIHTGVAVTEARPVGDNDTSRNRITQNAIHHNGHIDPGYLGIDLDFEPGVTPNDPGDADRGSNELINFPVIASAVHNSGITTVSGTIDVPVFTATIEVFAAIPGPDGSGHGQGAVYLGTTTAVAGTWTLVLAGGAAPGQWLTATATDPAGNTSEFASNVAVRDDNQHKFDYGDAPDPTYPTLQANGGPAHRIVPGMYLGSSIDGEADGQPDAIASGDDNDGNDDDDGVTFPVPLVAGQAAQIDIVASVTGWINAWIDFDADGKWHSTEQIVNNGIHHGGGLTESYSFTVPATAAIGATFARVRYDSGGNLLPSGPGAGGNPPDGEVEDYIVHIEDGSLRHKMHWAQLPDPNGWDVRGYSPKILADDFLCTETGPITRILFWGSWRQDKVGEIKNVHLSIHEDDRTGRFSKPGRLLWEANTADGRIGLTVPADSEYGEQGWLDPNSGEWKRGDHKMYFKYTVKIPDDMAFEQKKGMIYWLDLQVECAGGEWGWKTSRAAHFEDDAVWDDTPQQPHQWRELIDPETKLSIDLAFVIGGKEIEPEPKYDFGDAPDRPYPTLLSNDGARHLIVPGMCLGASIDGEPDGEPDPAALGDDKAGIDDEDGIVFHPLIAGCKGVVDVTATGIGKIDAWVDFDGNGSWLDAGEQIVAGGAHGGGGAIVSYGFAVPPTATLGFACARVRFSSAGGLAPTGAAHDGEVEDHRAPVGKPVRVKIQVTPPSAPTTVTLNWAAEPGATQYSVYSSTTVTGAFPAAWTIEASGIAGLTWSEPLAGLSKFYVVVAFP